MIWHFCGLSLVYLLFSLLLFFREDLLNLLGSISPALGSIFEILVVVLIIVALVLVIKRLMRVADEF